MRHLLYVAVAAASACGGPFRPKLTDIEETRSSSLGVQVTRTELTYSGDELKSAVVSIESNRINAHYFFYTDGLLDTVERENAAGDLTLAFHFGYLGGRVSRFERRAPVFFADPAVPPAETRLVRQYSYGNHGVSVVSYSETQVVDIDTESVVEWEERYRYDDVGRLERITMERPAAVAMRELKYDDETGLLTWILSRTGGDTTSIKYDYEDTGRLDRVTFESQNYDFKYDEDNIQEIIHTAGDLEVITRYTYGDGSTEGFSMAPVIPNGEFFNLKGELVDELDFANSAALQ